MINGFDEFATVAARFGLRMTPNAPAPLKTWLTLDGAIDGVDVVARRWVDDFVHHVFHASIEPSLDLRLSIRRAGLASSIAHFFGKHDIETGDKAFDDAFEVKADEPERARALLGPGLRAALAPWKGAAFSISDESVDAWTLEGAFTSYDAAHVSDSLVATAAIARAFRDAAAAVPPSTILAPHAAAFREFADARGLGFSASPLRVSGGFAADGAVAAPQRAPGRSDGPELRVRAIAAADHGWGVGIRVAYDRPLPIFFQGIPARFYDFLLTSRFGGRGSHQATGDAAFDKAVFVLTSDPEAMGRFTPEVRGAIVDLSREGEVYFDAKGVGVRTRTMKSAAEIDALSRRVAAVAARLSA